MPPPHKQILKLYAAPDRMEAGCDEAGRGALISRVMAGAVIFPAELATDRNPDNLCNKIRDSKKVPPVVRERLYDFIKENAIAAATGWADEKEIDEINIRVATMRSFHRAIDALTIRPHHLLIDGPYFDEYVCPQRAVAIPHTCIIQGDNAFVSIAAASILAKVERDRYIRALCDKEPLLNERYGLLRNMGYGTADHSKGIAKWGTTPYHRQSFGICKTGGIPTTVIARAEEKARTEARNLGIEYLDTTTINEIECVTSLADILESEFDEFK